MLFLQCRVVRGPEAEDAVEIEKKGSDSHRVAYPAWRHRPRGEGFAAMASGTLPASAQCRPASGTVLARQHAMHHDDEIAEVIITLLQSRAEHATICPSEVARALQPVHWRPLMPQIRAVAATLAGAGQVELRQRGKVIPPFSRIRGALRIALGRRA